MISPAVRDALQLWLEAQKALKGASENTISAYSRDVADFLAFITQHSATLTMLRSLKRHSMM